MDPLGQILGHLDRVKRRLARGNNDLAEPVVEEARPKLAALLPVGCRVLLRRVLKQGDPMPAKKSFLLRLDPELFDDLQSWAAAELRSVNGQIEYLLASAVRSRRRKDAGPAAEAGGGAEGASEGGARVQK